MLALSDIKRARGVVKNNAGASLVDLGDGVAVPGIPQQDEHAGRGRRPDAARGRWKRPERNFDALVIANQGEHFSAGANLMMVLLAAQEAEWDELDAAMSAASSRPTWR